MKREYVKEIKPRKKEREARLFCNLARKSHRIFFQSGPHTKKKRERGKQQDKSMSTRISVLGAKKKEKKYLIVIPDIMPDKRKFGILIGKVFATKGKFEGVAF